MHIEIPNNLLRYKNDIEIHANELLKQKVISLKLVGQTKSENAYKELYIMHNPHMNNLSINLNCFNSNKDVFKMYPSEFVIESGNIQAFLVVSQNDIQLQLDDSIVAYEYKTEIERSITNLVKKYQLQSEYKKPKAKIELVKDPDISKTIALTSNLSSFDEEFYKLKKDNKSNIKFHIKSVKKKNDSEIVNCIVKNTSKTNLIIEHIKIRFLDEENELIVNMHKPIKLKGRTLKNINLSIPNSKFSDININRASIRVLIN